MRKILLSLVLACAAFWLGRWSAGTAESIAPPRLDSRTLDASATPKSTTDSALSIATDVPARGRGDGTSAEYQTSSSPASSSEPRRSADPRVIRYEVLKAQLDELRSANDHEAISRAGLVMNKGIALVLEASGRSQPFQPGTEVRLSGPGAGSNQRVFYLNDAVYRFDSWEFPEFDEYQSFVARTGRDHSASLPPDLLEEILSRAQEGLDILQTGHLATTSEGTPK